jgi:hypothetical protein
MVNVGFTVRRLIGTLRERRVVAAALLTAVTLVLVAAVTLTTTSLGCRFGIKSTYRCASPVAAVSNVSPLPTPTFSIPTPQPTFVPNPNPPPASNPYTAPASNPFPYPATGANPPFNPGASGANAYYPPDSASVPPFSGGASSSGPALALSCRLPVYAGGPGSGGFVIFPGSTFVADPNSAVTAPSPSPGSPSPPPPPGYYGYPQGWWGTTYDRAYSRWLPVPRNWVTPDGTRYAYPGSSGVYVQDIVKGANVELGEGRTWTVLDVESEGVYATSPPGAGLWLLPFSGAETQITAVGYWQGVAAGAAYGTETSAVPQGATNSIIKLDIKSRTTTSWFTRTGAQSRVLGFDGQGDPIIVVNGSNNGFGATETWITTGANTGIPIAVSTYAPYQQASGFSPGGTVIADSHGLWFTGNGGIALYVTGSGWYWMSSLGAQIAGTCA